jgi:hypothetical protein
MAGGTSVAPVETFLAALSRSGLIPATDVDAVRQEFADVADGRQIARELIKRGRLTKWQALQLLNGYFALSIGKYKLLDEIGAGELGRVYLAEHTQMERRQAIKILSRRQTSRPQVLERFLKEAPRVCALEHSNLCQIYDVNQDADRYFLVMQHIEGVDLAKQVAKSGPLPVVEAVQFAAQAAEGLAYAHERQVFHGVLKPANLLVDGQGIVKLTDIGQARLLEGPVAEGVGDTTEAVALAAAIYHAPELRSGTAAVSGRSDIYSLGNVLCFLLTGKPALDAVQASQILGQVPGVPAELIALVGRMLAEDPAQRPTAMSAVLAELVAIGLELPASRAAASGTSAAPAATLPATPLPKAKPLPPEPATAKSPAAAPPGAKPARQPSKAPPVATPLAGDADSGSVPVEAVIEAVIEDDAPIVLAGQAPSPKVDSAAPFAIQVGARERAKPPVAPAAVAPPATASADTRPASAASPASKSKLPLILAGAIGGGLLLVVGLGVAVYVVANWGKGEKQQLVAQADAVPTASEAPAGEANPETNPEANPEVNPEPAPDAAPPPSAPVTPEPATPAASALPAVQQLPGAAPTDAPPPMGTPFGAAPAVPSAATDAPVNPALPDAAASDTAPTEPAPAEAEAAPEPAKPEESRAGNPFQGFAAAVELPPLTSTVAEPAEPLSPVALGPCVVDEKALVIIHLQGGSGAVRGGKQTFELKEASGGTSLREWEISLLSGDTGVVVARLEAKDGQLWFQWQRAAPEQTSAALLQNCGLSMSAGADHHKVALRKPVIGEPLAVNYEKPGAVRWTIESLPDPKSIMIEIGRLEGDFQAHKFDKQPLEGSDTGGVWVGTTEESLVLGLKLTTSLTARGIEVKSTPQIKTTGMKRPTPLNLRDLTSEEKKVAFRREQLTVQVNSLPKQKNEAVDRQRNLMNVEIEKVNAYGDQLTQLASLVENLNGKAKIHFRVFYQTEDGEIDLLTTDEGAATEPAEPVEPAEPAAEPKE